MDQSRRVYEVFSLAFHTELDRASHPVIRDLVSKHIVRIKDIGRLMKEQITQADDKGVLFSGFWVKP